MFRNPGLAPVKGRREKCQPRRERLEGITGDSMGVKCSEALATPGPDVIQCKFRAYSIKVRLSRTVFECLSSLLVTGIHRMSLKQDG